jgi:uncharacterized protein YjbJ (UPF0337 family)
MAMNKDRIEGNWKQLKGSVRQQWGRFTGNQWDVITGKRDYFAGVLQEIYGTNTDKAEKQLCDLENAPPAMFRYNNHKIDFNKHMAGCNKNMVGSDEYYFC